MSSAKTQPARGMRDFLPADVRKREYVIGVIKEVYERYGFEPLETPAVENIETLMGKYGEEGNQLIFKILKRGEHEKSGQADLALRYDLTVPLARVVAQYQNELPKFFKRYQIQPVWRADRPARGRFREFYQCDVDVLGSRSMLVEAELMAAASDALVALGFHDFKIRLNHRGVLNGILEKAGVSENKYAEALIALDKLDKIGREGVEREFKARGVVDEASSKLFSMIDALESGKFDATLGGARTNALTGLQETIKEREAIASGLGILLGGLQGREQDGSVKGALANAQREASVARARAVIESIFEFTGASQALIDLAFIVGYLRGTDAVNHIRVDPWLARGLSYYTGSIFEIAVEDLAGSLGGGGRYDNLVGMFLGKDVPACGFSLGLERIIVVMSEREMFPPELASSPADVMVTIWNEESLGESLALATELRNQGLRVDLYPEADKMGKQFKYASSRGIPFIAIVGDDERARGEVAIKDLRSGEQRSVKRSEVVSAVQNRER